MTTHSDISNALIDFGPELTVAHASDEAIAPVMYNQEYDSGVEDENSHKKLDTGLSTKPEDVSPKSDQSKIDKLVAKIDETDVNIPCPEKMAMKDVDLMVGAKFEKSCPGGSKDKSDVPTVKKTLSCSSKSAALVNGKPQTKFPIANTKLSEKSAEKVGSARATDAGVSKTSRMSNLTVKKTPTAPCDTKMASRTSSAATTPRDGEKKIFSTPLQWKAESKVGSLQNASHKPGGGDVKIQSIKQQWNTSSRVGSLENAGHKPAGGDKKIVVKKTEWRAEPKVGSLANAAHKPGGGNVKVPEQSLNFKEKAAPKVGSLEKANHKPGGGNMEVKTEKLQFEKTAKSKVGSLDNAHHKPAGGNVKIVENKLNFASKAQSKLLSTRKKSDES